MRPRVLLARAAWHVHFDGDPELAMHVCERHRAIGASLPCPDARPDGDCDHVQTRPCTCEPRPACDACGVAAAI